ncbi:hypothetical protein KR009_009744 [Drosophila setifemur]|nr:hypothetical protein KR009_009744 [Drosophila setifemur]
MGCIQDSKIGLVIIGLAGIVISSATLALPYRYQTMALQICRLIEWVASILVIFGLLQKRTIHKAQFVLIWLICSLVFTTSILYNFSYFGSEHIEYIGILFIVMAGMTGLMYVMYNGYVKLIDDEKDVTMLPA